jgi:hypothetical protein
LVFKTAAGGANDERARITAEGRLGLGTSSPNATLDIANGGLQLTDTSSSFAASESLSYYHNTSTQYAEIQFKPQNASTGYIYFKNRVGSALTDVLTIQGSNVGIGTTTVDSLLHVSEPTNTSVDLLLVARGGNSLSSEVRFLTKNSGGTNVGGAIGYGTSGLTLTASATTIDSAQNVVIDGSGRLLVGTSTARAISTGNFHIQSEGTGAETGISTTRNSNSASGSNIRLVKTRGSTVGSSTIVNNGDGLGGIGWWGTDGTNAIEAANISTEVDGTPGANDMPGRLVFSTTADGASSPTEAMRITSGQSILMGKATSDDTNVGFRYTDGLISIVRNSNVPFIVNRLTNDGDLVQLRQGGITEGTISVSGTTVTYGGGHLARWSQLPTEEDPSGLLKGTVMSNLDEMCEWGDEDNEQLNKTKVSDVEGDLNVAGVFVSTSFDEDGPLDFFVAMTGDMIIRIAEGVTVQRGDLLMSAGDGTAKPQDDDIIRSKTIAKVTSTHVTCTYDDGSYCVPCVLMAC